MLSTLLVGAIGIDGSPAISISLVELGIVSGLVAILFLVLKWSTNRFLIGTVDRLEKSVTGNTERIEVIEKDLITSTAKMNALFMPKDEMIKILAEVNKRLDRTTDVCERLQIAVAELGLLIKETREELKELRKKD